jgi:hypothetical protein
MEEDFLHHMLDPHSEVDPATSKGRFNASLDHFSFHFYGDFKNGWSPDPAAKPYTTLRYLTSTVRAKLAALGHPQVKLFLSEWGPSADLNSDINYSHKGAAWVAAFLTEAVAAKIAMGSYLIMNDAVGYDPGTLGIPSLTYKVITGDGSIYYPKPPANVFRMFAMMTGTRRAVTLPATSNLGAFAASDGSSAGVVVFNYNNMFIEAPEVFSVELDHLPFDGAVTVKRYLVDADTSNLQAFLLHSGHPDPSLQMVEQFSAEVQDGRLTLPSRSLGLGVTFWRVSR